MSWLSISIFLRENVTEGIGTGTIQLFLRITWNIHQSKRLIEEHIALSF